MQLIRTAGRAAAGAARVRDRAPHEPLDFQDFAVALGGQLFRTAYLLTAGDAHAAEDLVQEALGRMFARWGRLSQIENPAGYAQKVLANVFVSQRRKRSSTERPFGELPERAERATHPADPELRLTLLAALSQLPERDRAVLVLRYWEDRSVEETAETLRLSSTAVRSRSSRALERLRGLLGGSLAGIAER